MDVSLELKADLVRDMVKRGARASPQTLPVSDEEDWYPITVADAFYRDAEAQQRLRNIMAVFCDLPSGGDERDPRPMQQTTISSVIRRACARLDQDPDFNTKEGPEWLKRVHFCCRWLQDVFVAQRFRFETVTPMSPASALLMTQDTKHPSLMPYGAAIAAVTNHTTPIPTPTRPSPNRSLDPASAARIRADPPLPPAYAPR